MRNRYAVGNICLLLFVAFLAMTALGTLEAGKAYAQVEFRFDYDSGTYSSRELRSRIWVYPLTSAEDVGFVYYFRLFNDADKRLRNASGEVYKPSVSQYTYDLAYRNLVELVYTVPSGWQLNPNYTVAFWRVYEDIVNGAVYVDLLYKPPTGGPGPGGAVTPPTTTVSSPTGNIVVTPSLGTALLTVVESKALEVLRSLAAEVKEFVVANLSGVSVAERAASIVPSILKAAFEAAKDVVVNAGQVVVTLPQGSVDVGAIEQAGAGAGFKISAEILDEETSKGIIEESRASAEGFNPMSGVFTLVASIVKGNDTVGGVERFEKPVKVSFAYSPKPGVDEDKLGAYRYDPSSKTWQYVGGKVLKDTKQVVAKLWHFSDYAVMAYEKTFADIASHWAKADIELMASKHVVKGMSDTAFAPEAHVTRAQFAALLLRSLGLEEAKPATETFHDVASGAWYFGAVEGAFRAGLVKGYEDGTFRPDATITREEMAAMVVRALKIAGVDTSVTQADIDAALARFADKGAISEWAKESAALAAKSGIVLGRTESSYAPKGTGTRAEATVMMKRLLTLSGDI
jgi:hypothetical protein